MRQNLGSGTLDSGGGEALQMSAPIGHKKPPSANA